jgi:hypothetical protein
MLKDFKNGKELTVKSGTRAPSSNTLLTTSNSNPSLLSPANASSTATLNTSSDPPTAPAPAPAQLRRVTADSSSSTDGATVAGEVVTMANGADTAITGKKRKREDDASSKVCFRLRGVPTTQVTDQCLCRCRSPDPNQHSTVKQSSSC